MYPNGPAMQLRDYLKAILSVSPQYFYNLITFILPNFRFIVFSWDSMRT